MKIKDCGDFLIVIEQDKKWNVIKEQHIKVADTKIYKMDDDYLLFEEKEEYGLLKVISATPKKMINC